MTTGVESLPMVVRADHVLGPRQGCWTYEDYAALPDDGNRYEIVDGVLYMPPAPNIAHQIAVTGIGTHLTVHVQWAGLGRVLVAPTDLQLPLTPAVTVQPDIVVVLNANLSIIKDQRIEGVPDLVVEVTSPGTAGYDRRTKQDAYARAGVPEYWIADPYAKAIEVLLLENGAYVSAGVFQGRATLPSRVISDLPVRVEQFFA